MHRVLLHLVEHITLEYVTEEALVGLLEALEVILEGLGFGLEHPHFSERQSGVQSVADLIEVEDLLVDVLRVEIFHQVGVFVFLNRQRPCGHHAVVHVVLISLILVAHLLLDLVVHFEPDDRVDFV